MPGLADAAAESPVTIRPRDRVDNRDEVIGPLPMAAPPVLGDWAVDPE
jgi:hypothetical protein